VMIERNYDAKKIEKKWQDFWDKEKIFKFDEKSKKKVYSIDVPPPYASAGHLHIGHALHYTQFEIIARFRRMYGYNVYFAPCFDNNGLPTEKYVEEKFNVNKNNISRAEFRKLCLEESRKVEKGYADRFFKALGHSYDWDLFYTTIDSEAQKVSQRSFIDLSDKGDCYRAKEPTIWCTYHQTALAQAEVEDLKRETKLNYIDFDLEDGKKINIATTRPEFLAACVGIFVNPNDKKNLHLIGKKAIVPLFNHKVKIMKDEKVDPSFGSGIVMVCTFGDNTDVEWWKKHKLELRMCITSDGRMNELAGKYVGLKLEEARKAILEDLEREGRLKKQEKLDQVVGSCWRCNTPVEFIVTEQWFIKTLKYKRELIKQGKKIKWYPDFYRKRFENWTKNLSWDWCISRQRFYGVPIPVWYCENCGKTIIADKKDLPIDPIEEKPKKKCKCGSDKFKAEYDVFDTWMTSSVSPQIALRWLEKPSNYKRLFPMSYRAQSSDIIRTWAFYTILKSYLHFKKIPWKDIAISTFVLDEKGHGMHKSKGNAIWTHQILDKYNADVLRYWVGDASWGSDLSFQEKEFVAGSRFLNKLWNASRLVLMNLKDYRGEKPKLELMDKWMLSKLDKVIKVATDNFLSYNTNESKRAAEQLFWHGFCDNYLEIVKDRLYNEDIRGKNARKSAQYTLYHSLLNILKLMAPITPHITEEIYQSYFREREKSKSIHISDWPKYSKGLEDKEAEKIGEKVIEIIEKVRKFKAEHKKSLKTEVVLTLDKKYKKDFIKIIDDLKAVTNAKEIKFEGKFKVEI